MRFFETFENRPEIDCLSNKNRFEEYLQSLRYVFSLCNLQKMIFNCICSEKHSLLGNQCFIFLFGCVMEFPAMSS